MDAQRLDHAQSCPLGPTDELALVTVLEDVVALRRGQGASQERPTSRLQSTRDAGSQPVRLLEVLDQKTADGGVRAALRQASGIERVCLAVRCTLGDAGCARERL